MNVIDFCRQTCRPQETALYAVGGFLSGRCIGTISPMDGAVYMATLRVAYLVSQKLNNEALDYLSNKITGFGKQISSGASRTISNQSLLSRLKSRSVHLATSWINLVPGKLPLLKEPMKFINVYLSYMAGNGFLYLLGKQPVGLLATIGIFFSSTVFAVLAGSSIDLAKGKRAAC